MKTYSIQTVEDNELYVKDYIDTHFDDVKATIPVTSEVVEVDGKNVLTFFRTLEEYVLITSKDSAQEHLKQLSKISGVVKVLADKNTSGVAIQEIPEEEASAFLGGIPKDTLKLLRSGYVNIISGAHSGRRGKVLSYKAPVLKVAVISAVSKKKVATIMVALWDIVKVLE